MDVLFRTQTTPSISHAVRLFVVYVVCAMLSACNDSPTIAPATPDGATSSAADRTPDAAPVPIMSEIKGEALYRERIALPPDAVFEATLEDVSRADGESEVLGSAVIEPAGQPPFRFTIDYDRAKLQNGHQYAIRARVRQGERLLFTTDRRYALPQPNEQIEILLVRAPAQAQAESTSTATLLNTYWKLMKLGDEAVTVSNDQREPYMVLYSEERRVAGYAGCNRMTGSYVLSEDTLTFSQMAGTMMACEEGMDIERGFFDMLGKAARWRIKGETLELFDNAGQSIALFESRYMQ